MSKRDEALKAERILKTLLNQKVFNTLNFYQPYPKQQQFHDMSIMHRERLLLAGNRCGKTFCGAAEMAYHLTGRYPDWWLGRRFDRPIEAWAANDTGETTRNIVQTALCGKYDDKSRWGSGAIPRDCVNWDKDVSLSRGTTDAFDTVTVKHFTNGVFDGYSSIGFKSFDQGRKKWQGTAKDVIWLDEEAPEDIYTEALARIAPQHKGQTSGIIYTTFTPLSGPTKVVNRFLREKSDDRGCITMTIDDAEHIDPAERQKIIDGYPEHEREARAEGRPILGSGLIFKYAEKDIRVDAFEVPYWWPGLWALDFGTGHPFAAALLRWDRDADVVYLTAAIRMKDRLPIDHVDAMRPFGLDYPVAWPQDGHQREEFDGKLEPLSKIYKIRGLKRMQPHHATFEDGSNSTEVGILKMQERLRTGKFKVFAHLAPWFEEYRVYHRKDGLIVKEDDDLMSASRVGIMALRGAKLTSGAAMRVAGEGGGSKPICKGIDREAWGA